MWFNFISGQREYNFVFGVNKKAVALKLLMPESVSMFLMAPMIPGSNHCMRYVGGRNPLRNELPFFPESPVWSLLKQRVLKALSGVHCTLFQSLPSAV